MKKLLFFAFSIALASCTQPVKVYDLKVDALDSPVGIDSGAPHFSWKISSRSPMEQTAYQILVLSRTDGSVIWDSGKVESADQVMVPYGGSEIAPRSLCTWQVKVWNQEGKASTWSKPQRFGTGIFGPASLEGALIGAVPGEGRSALLRKIVSLDSKPKEAVFYVNSLGYHELWINSRKVGDGVLMPAVSQLDKRSLIVAYDVAPYLKSGENDVVLWTSSGWYKSATFDATYDGALVKAELDVFSADGASSVLVTDGSWQGAWSGYRDTGTWKAHYFGGECIDARVVPASFKKTDLDALEWGPVDVIELEGIEASMQMCEVCKVQERIHPVSIEKIADSVYLVDFGKTVNAMVEVSLPALPAGHVVTTQVSDWKDLEGNMDFHCEGDKYIASGAASGDSFVPHFNHHVFRYIQFENLPRAPKLKDITALRMRTDFEAASTFSSSDPDLNAIYDMVSYTLENLAFDGYMVDCANIERLGYGGDGNASTQTLQDMASVSPLYYNWLLAWKDCINEDGGLPHTAPCPYRAGGGPYWCTFIVQAPYRTYISYGDSRLIDMCYDDMLHWLQYVDAYTVDGLLRRWPGTEYRHWYLGDWAEPPGMINVKDPESIDLVNNCALCQTYIDLMWISIFRGDKEAQKEFTLRYRALKDRINETFYHSESHTYGSASQTDMVYPMLVGVVPGSEIAAVKAKLFEITAEKHNGHLVTGLVGIPVITEWATREKECDWMYGMLKKHDYPGYLYMIDNGATSTWEHWEGRRSRLHNCYNGIGSWFFEALGGIIPQAPGYRKVKIEPQVPEGLESVSVTKQTPYGPIVVNRRGSSLHVEIPVGVTATILDSPYGPGSYDFEL